MADMAAEEDGEAEDWLTQEKAGGGTGAGAIRALMDAFALSEAEVLDYLLNAADAAAGGAKVPRRSQHIYELRDNNLTTFQRLRQYHRPTHQANGYSMNQPQTTQPRTTNQT